jgi:hypothetical protein
MKNTILMLFVASILSFTSEKAFAQFEKGDKLLNLGIGLNSYYGGGVPIGAAFEYGITDEISIGAQIDFSRWSYGYGGYKWSYTFVPVAVRGSYHFGKLINLPTDKLDLYGGAALGYYISKYKDNTGYTGYYDNVYGNKALFGIYAGGRYYFKDNIAGFAEVGYGVSTLKVGVTFKF